MELALGTVQFGLGYGIVGNAAAVPEEEVEGILALAHESGIRRLDTALAYGDIVPRLARLCGNRDFDIVSKIPAMPKGIALAEQIKWIEDAVEENLQYLGDRLCGLIFHDYAPLLEPPGEQLWAALERAVSGKDIRIGGSHYDPAEVASRPTYSNYAMAQLPGNAYDQRIKAHKFGDIEISMRSVLLQGLLVMDPDTAASRLPQAASWLGQWHQHCATQALSPPVAAFSAAKGFEQVDFCLFGVDSFEQLSLALAAWESASPTKVEMLAGSDPAIFDPRKWEIFS